MCIRTDEAKRQKSEKLKKPVVWASLIYDHESFERKIAMKTFVSFVVVLLCVSSAFAEVMYSITDLGPATTSSSDGTDTKIVINNNGAVVWTRKINNESLTDAVRYENGAVTSLNAGTPRDISDNGVIVGQIGSTAGNGGQPFMWQSGATSTFQIPTGTGSYGIGGIATGVNNTSIVVGYYYDSPSRPEKDTRPFYYQNGNATKLSCYGVGGYNYSFGHANAINDVGTIVGNVSDHSGNANDPGKAVAWFGPGYSPVDLGAGLGSQALIVNDDNLIVGINGSGSTFVWENGTIEWITTTGGSTKPLSVNSLGEILGIDYSSKHLYLWKDGLFTDIDPFGSDICNFSLARASINDLGQIATLSHFDDGSTRALLLTPIPEPSTMVLLISGLIAGRLFLRRKK